MVIVHATSFLLRNIIMMKRSFSLYILPMLFGLTPAAAQFNQSISVDGKYTPEIIRLDRINSFPALERFTMETSPLAYDASGVPASFSPSLITMPATGWRDTRKISRNRGYLELGAGSWLNSTLSAGYRFINNDLTTLGVRLQHNSTSIWKPEITPLYSDTRQWKYDESLGIYGSHLFEEYGRLEAAIDWHIGNFNYYGFAPEWAGLCNPKDIPAVPTQTLNDISARVGWKSAEKHDAITWNASAGVRYFGYRSFYFPEFDSEVNCIKGSLARLSSTRETDVNIRGGFLFPTSSKSGIGVDLDADIVGYSGYKDIDPKEGIKPDTYGVVKLTPYYRFSIDKLNLRLGAQIDIAAKAGEEDDRYSALHFAPSVTLDYNAGPVQLYLRALGGSRLHTLASGYELDYYQQPFITSTRPVYSPLDGSLGFTFGPFSGFSAGFDFAFRISRGEYLGGWYTTMMNDYEWTPAPGLPDKIGDSFAEYTYNSDQTTNLHGYSVGLNLNYDFGKILKLSARGNYQPQKGTTGYFNGYDRPRWTARFTAETNPWGRLKFILSYDYRGVRNCYTSALFYNDANIRQSELTSMRLPDLTMLGFGASYGFSDSFSAWIQADNLLNRHDITLPRLPQQGIRLAAGISFLFD